MSNPIYGCGIPGCRICGPRRHPSARDVADIMRRTLASMDRWREREASRLRRLYPQPSPLQRLVEEIKTRRAAR